MFSFNPSKIMFSMMLIAGTLISISSTSWPATWIGLEINLLAFIPLLTSKTNILSTEASMKYFIIQALASSLLITILITTNITHMILNSTMLQVLMSLTLLIKMGAAPFHMWFPSVMEGLTWINCLILMTWQKIAPMMILSYFMTPLLPFYIIIMSSIMVGSIGGLNQTSTRKIMAYSSINHIGWLLLAMATSEVIWQHYLTIYFIIVIALSISFMSMSTNHINQIILTNTKAMTKLIITMNLLSLGGLPPFLGFLPKWLVIQISTQQGITIMITMMVIMTLGALFYYINMGISSFMLNFNQTKWQPYNIFQYTYIIAMTSSMSILSLPIYPLLFLNF
uniref:NADH-ubiquinone oxidoreductase chain 2 n=1 Tax=Xenogryllus marmoratus TaxID=323499 RepID=A0A411LWK8_9ORTH|nr:NADH dehydrogenase subunit 2 [Xenogryllus marmoratus]QBF03777.1 NADH dehydrogenase subunit 2 [Xenogryllus marmoratus]